MTAHCNIGVLQESGHCVTVYCHNNGWPRFVGRTLLDHYPSRELAWNLLKNGDIHFLEESVDLTEYYVEQGKSKHTTIARSWQVGQVLTEGEEYVYLWSEKNECWLYADIGHTGGKLIVLRPDICGIGEPEVGEVITERKLEPGMISFTPAGLGGHSFGITPVYRESFVETLPDGSKTSGSRFVRGKTRYPHVPNDLPDGFGPLAEVLVKAADAFIALFDEQEMTADELIEETLGRR
jgi:hypothetical protein